MNTTFEGVDRPATESSGDRPDDRTPLDEAQGQAKKLDLNEELRNDAEEVKRFTDDQTKRAREVATNLAEKEKNFAARQMRGIANALQKVGAELEGAEQEAVGQYARKLGNSLQELARDLKDRDLGELAATAEDFGRRQPVAFLSMAALAGFAASRFLTASAGRRNHRQSATASTPAHSQATDKVFTSEERSDD